MRQKGKNTGVLDKTHPPYVDRIALLKRTIAQEGVDTGSYHSHQERFAEVVKELK